MRIYDPIKFLIHYLEQDKELDKPNYVIHADDVLWLITCIVDNGGSCLHPHPVTALAYKPVVLANRCSFYYH